MPEDFNLDIPRIGYFIVYEGNNSWFSRQIKRVQKDQGLKEWNYTHIEISGGGQWTVGAIMPKAKLIDILKKYKGRKVRIVKYKEYEGNDKRYKVGWFTATLCNLPYGWWTAVWYLLREKFAKLTPWTTKRSPVCSVLCAWGLTRVFKDAFEDYREILPAHFLNEEKFEVVWEGIIDDPDEIDEERDILKKLMEDK